MKRIACLLVTAPLAALGCTDAPIVLPRAIVDIDVSPSATVGSCGFVTSDLVSIGCAGTGSRCSGNAEGRYLPVTHGSTIDSDGTPSDRGIEVHVYCTIVSTANAFDVKVSALRVDPLLEVGDQHLVARPANGLAVSALDAVAKAQVVAQQQVGSGRTGRIRRRLAG